MLNIDWDTIENCNNVNDACDEFYSKLYQVCDLYVPIYKNTLKTKRTYPNWYNSEIIKNIETKYRYLQKYRKSRTEHDLNNFKRLRTHVKNLISIAYNTYLQTITNNITKDPKQFWHYVQSKNTCTRIPGKMFFNNSTLEEPNTILNGFADFFSSVYQPNCNSVSSNLFYCHSNFLNINEITYDDIRQAVKKLSNKATAGDDQIPSYIIKDCAEVFIKPLHFLFNLSIKTANFPKKWKTARLCPVFKSGDANTINNYRPIAILNNFSKVFEMVIYKYLYSFFQNYLSVNQHGFVKNRSTTSNLACLTQFISEELDAGGQVDVIYTDFSKVFDSLHHDILEHKLHEYGVSNSLVALLKSYLKDRTHFVSFNGHCSKHFSPTSGVPQGSNLGPLLFLIFVNDVCTAVSCEILMFADDLKLFSPIKSVNCCVNLQSQIDQLQQWCDDNKLCMNISKCMVISFTRKHNSVLYDYTFKSVPLKRTYSTRDLGVIFDHKLTFSNHITSIINSAMKILGFVIRSTSCLPNTLPFILLYFSLVRSKLEYCSIVWCPFYEVYKIGLERVQRKFLKVLCFRSTGQYPVQGYSQSTLLSDFKILSLDFRRIQCSLIFLYKIIHNLIDSPFLLNQLNFIVPRLHSRKHKDFYCKQSYSNMNKKSPIHIMCNNVNNISDHIDIHFCSINNIKNVCCGYFP